MNTINEMQVESYEDATSTVILSSHPCLISTLVDQDGDLQLSS